MTTKATLQIVANHLAKQRQPAKRTHPNANFERQVCAYRGDNNTSCGIGHLIPNDLYTPAIEDTYAKTFLNHLGGLFDAEDHQAVKAVGDHLTSLFSDITAPHELRSILDTVQSFHDTKYDFFINRYKDAEDDVFAKVIMGEFKRGMAIWVTPETMRAVWNENA